MTTSMQRRPILALCLLMLPALPGECGLLQSLEVILAGPAELGVAALEIDGSTDLSTLAPLGGIEANLAGDQIYLAVNADRATPGATRMIRFDKAAIVRSLGAVTGATAASTANPYLTNVKLAGDTHNPNNHAGDFLLGMSSDPNTGDVYLAAQDGVASMALLRIASGIGSASGVVEFAASNTDSAQIPAPYRLSPNFCPSFVSTMMGPESVAAYTLASATDLYYFADGSSLDFALCWAVQDLVHRRESTVPNKVTNLVGVPDNDLYTDEMRVHATALAGSHTFNPVAPTIHSDVVLIPQADRMVFISGRNGQNNLFLINDLNDNTEIGGINLDTPQLTAVATSRTPTALTNIFLNGQVVPNAIYYAAYSSGLNNTQIVRVNFSASGSVLSQVPQDLTTTGDVLPGRISEITTDSEGTIYAVDGENGVIHALAPNEDPIPTPTPTPLPAFSCFATDTLTQGGFPQFTPNDSNSLVTYATSFRGQDDVLTELMLPNLGTYTGWNGVTAPSEPRRFYYVNRPIVISSGDRLTVSNSDWFIFRSDGVRRAFLEVNGRLICDTVPADVALGPNPGFSQEDFEEAAEVRFTSVVGFISWLKDQGVPNLAALGMPLPTTEAGMELQAFASAIFPLVDPDPDVAINQIATNFFGSGTGRWGGIYFSDSDVGGSSATASRIQFARVDFAEVGVYAQDRTLDNNLVRDENALRIVSSILERNLIGLSIDGFSPVVANNIIRYSKRDPSFDARSFNNTTPRTTACNLTSAQRFPVGASGAGVFVTKRRSSSSVATDPLFFQNEITDNELVGVQVQQNGVAVSYGSPTTFNRPKPRFGRAVTPIDSAHEFQNVGQNRFASNGPIPLAALHVIYNVRESPADNGVGSLSHPADMPAQNNDWGTPDPNEINQSVRDGLDEFNDLGEVIFSPFLTPAPAATPPLVNRVPDIRNVVAPGGDAFSTLDLDDYALDSQTRDPVTGAQDSLTWTETGSNTNILAPFNTLEAIVPVSAAPNQENVILTVSNGTPPNPVNNIRIHTSNILLGDPLVDTQIGKGDGSLNPHGWCLKGGANGTGPISIPQAQSGAGGGVLQLTLTSGLGVTPLFRDDSLVSSSSELANPLAPSSSSLALKGHALGAPGPGPVSLTAANLQVDADLNGVTVIPQAAFSDWVRLSVTRKLADGSDDSYSLAIADLLLGQTSNLVGNAFGAASIIGATENHAFENINLTQFLGATSSTDMNSLTPANRRAALISQQSSWSVLAVGMGTDGSFSGGGNYPDLDLTATGKPAATYPGATSGNALRVTFNKSGLQGVFLGHKGIPNTAYNEGDVLTMSLNAYVDLAYNGAADELINEPTAGMAIAFALFTLPGSAAQSVNYLFFPPPQSTASLLRKGVAPGTSFGRGGGQTINPLALIHGKWTRHEVSLRIPEIGQNYQGPVGSGNIVDSLGVEGLIMLSRIDAPAGLPDQSVWLDNICISRCPGSLALAHGAIQVPMVSAGFSLPFTNGANAGPGSFFTGANGFGSDIAMPVALNRGQTIFGGFTQGGSGASQPVTPVAASTFWGTATNSGKTGMSDLAYAGFLRGPAQGGAGAPVFDSAVVAAGGVDVALNFPSLPDGNRGLVMGPSPAAISGNAFQGSLTTGIASSGYNGEAVVNTPYLDMRAASDAMLPGLREADVTFAGGAGGSPSGENGNLNPNQVLSNIAGVFGVRWFTRSNAAEVSHNPILNVLFTNADFLLGLQATRKPSALPTGADLVAPDGVWVDDFVSGSFITFNSFQKYYDIVLNNQAGGLTGIAGEVPAALLADLTATNPGAQLAQVSLYKTNGNAFGITVRDIINNTNLKGFSGIFAPGLDGPVTLTDSLPGRYGTACISIDEINLYGVRDSAAFYDEDLQRSDLLP